MDEINVFIDMGYRDVEGKRYVNLEHLIEVTKELSALKEQGYDVDFKNLASYLENMAND